MVIGEDLVTDWISIKAVEKLEKDPTELVWCEWKEGGSRYLETRWTLRELQVEKMTWKGTPQWGGAREEEEGPGSGSQTSSTKSQRAGERPVQVGGVIFDSRDFWARKSMEWRDTIGNLLVVVAQSLSLVWLLRPHGLQHMRLPCPSPSSRVCLNSCPSSRWCHPTISSSVAPFFSCPQSFPVSGSFPMSRFFPSGGQGIRASAPALILRVNMQGWFPGLIF